MEGRKHVGERYVPGQKGVISQDIKDLKEEIAALKKENAKLKTKIEILAQVTNVKFVDLEKPETTDLAKTFNKNFLKTKIEGIQEI
jgi:cell division protein FtsB